MCCCHKGIFHILVIIKIIFKTRLRTSYALFHSYPICLLNCIVQLQSQLSYCLNVNSYTSQEFNECQLCIHNDPLNGTLISHVSETLDNCPWLKVTTAWFQERWDIYVLGWTPSPFSIRSHQECLVPFFEQFSWKRQTSVFEQQPKLENNPLTLRNADSQIFTATAFITLYA